MGDAIRFWFRGELVELVDVPATTTVLDWLRGNRRSLGTKEGCNEGDCGACAVALGRPDGHGGLALTVAHACLLLVPMLHGAALVTVEDLADDAGLHPVQQELVDRHGSQCGFCTPGIVMSLWRLHQSAMAAGGVLTPEDVRAGLAGHVCRCTGYRSIVESGVAASAHPAPVIDSAAIVAALADVPASDALDYSARGTRFVAPTTVAALVQARADHPDARIVAGGTDVVPAVPGRGDLPGEVIWTGRVGGLADVVDDGHTLTIGGAATIEAGWSALARHWPHLATAWRRFASPAVRETGTLVGNLVTASPIGDSAPVLLVLDARIVVAGPAGERVLALDDFFTGYRRTALRADEVVVRVEVPLGDAGDVRMFKVARRYDNDIATVSAAFAVQVVEGDVRRARVAFGGMTSMPARARRVESAVIGRPWGEAALSAAKEALTGDVQPISDHRASADYRLDVAHGLLERWWLQTRPVTPLPAERTEVWGMA